MWIRLRHQPCRVASSNVPPLGVVKKLRRFNIDDSVDVGVLRSIIIPLYLDPAAVELQFADSIAMPSTIYPFSDTRSKYFGKRTQLHPF